MCFEFCPVCKTGSLEYKEELDVVHHGKQTEMIELECMVCNQCHQRIEFPDQVKNNLSRIRAAFNNIN